MANCSSTLDTLTCCSWWKTAVWKFKQVDMCPGSLPTNVFCTSPVQLGDIIWDSWTKWADTWTLRPDVTADSLIHKTTGRGSIRGAGTRLQELSSHSATRALARHSLLHSQQCQISKNDWTFVIYCVELSARIIPNVPNNLQIHRNLWFYSS